MRDAMLVFGALAAVVVGALALLTGAAIGMDRAGLGMAPSLAACASMGLGVVLLVGGAWAAWRTP